MRAETMKKLMTLCESHPFTNICTFFFKSARYISVSLILLILTGSMGLLRGVPNQKDGGWWPLPENYGLTSTFGELRYFHFHAGIDFSTALQIGLPVRVWKEGEIFRLRYDKRGYGKALYVRHPDGKITLYAHLDRFENEHLGLEDFIRKIQNETGKWYIGAVPVDPPVHVPEGAIIAYTGESGAGLPHLHFEIRSPENEPLNPFLEGVLDRGDGQSPIIQGLVFIPASSRTLINGKPGPLFLNTTGLKKQSPLEVVITGPFELRVSTFDPTFKPYIRTPFRVRVLLDNLVVYDWFPRSFTFTDTFTTVWAYDFSKQGRPSWVAPLRITGIHSVPPTMVSKYPEKVLDVLPGVHSLQIISEDSRGHKTSFRMKLIRIMLPELTFEKIDATRYVYRMPHTERHEQTSDDGPNAFIARLTSSEPISSPLEKCTTVTLTYSSPYMKIPSELQRTPCSEKIYTLKMKAFLLGFRLFSSSNPPTGRAWCSKPDRCFDYIPWKAVPDSLYRTLVKQPSKPLLKAVKLKPDRAYRLRIKDMHWRIPAKGVWSPSKWYWLTWKTVPIPDGLVPVQGPFIIEPVDIPFLKPHIIEYSPQKKHRKNPGEPVGIFWYHPIKKKWFFGGEFPDHPTKLVTRVPRIIMIAVDHAPPVLHSVQQKKWNPRRGPLRILFDEVGFGINEDKIRFLWDGQEKSFPEVMYDPDWPAISFRPSTPPPPGPHAIQLTIEDFAGNSASATFQVHVLPPRP